MLGNAWEWVVDCYQSTYAGAPTDGSEALPGSCSNRVLRGGAWNDFPRLLRAAHRHRDNSGSRMETNGFRVARDLAR